LYVNSNYSIRVMNKNGSLMYSAPVATERYGDIISSADIAFLQAGTGAITRTAQAKLRDEVSVKDFGAVGDGVANDTAAIKSASAELEVLFSQAAAAAQSAGFNPGAQPQSPDSGSQEPSEPKQAKGKVVDADFEVVDEDKK
jgi:hypothetical protein